MSGNGSSDDEKDMDDSGLAVDTPQGPLALPYQGPAGAAQIGGPKSAAVAEHPVFLGIQSQFPLRSDVHAVQFNSTGQRLERKAARDADEELKAAQKQHAEEVAALQQQLKNKAAELELKNRELARREDEARERQALATTDQKHRHEMDTLRAELDARKAELEAKKLEAQQARDKLEAERKSRDEELKERAQRMAEEKAKWQVLQDKQEDARKQQALQYQRELNTERQEWVEKKAELDALKAELDRKQTFDLKVMELASRGESEVKKGDLQKELEALRSADKLEERKLRAQLAAEAERSKNLQRDLDRARAEASETRKLELEQAKMEAIQELQRDKQALERQVKEAQQELARERLVLEKQAADARAEQIRTKDALDMANLNLKKTQMDRVYELQVQKLQTDTDRELFKRQKEEDDRKLQREAEAARAANTEKLAAIQLELAQIKSEDAKAAAAAAAEAREAQKQRDAAAALAQTEKFAFERRKKEMEQTMMELKVQAETAKAEREQAQIERDALKEERELQIRAGTEAWRRMREEMQLRFQEGKEFDARRVTDAELRKREEDKSFAADVANVLQDCAVIIKGLTTDEDLANPMDLIVGTESMVIDVNNGLATAQSFLRYLKEANTIATATNKVMGELLRAVLPAELVGEQRLLPRLRTMVTLVNQHVAGLRQEMTAISEQRRGAIDNPLERNRANQLFRTGSFGDIIRWFTDAALSNPMMQQRMAMWFQKAQAYEARYYVARALLLAIGVFLESQKEEQPFTGVPFVPQSLPPSSLPSRQDRIDRLYQTFPPSGYAAADRGSELKLPPAAAAAAAARQENPDAEMKEPTQGRATGRRKTQKSRTKKKQKIATPSEPPMTGWKTDQFEAKRAEQLQEVIHRIVDGVHVQINKLDPQQMWGEATVTMYGDFGVLQQYTNEWAQLIQEKFTGIGMQSPEATVITAISTAINAFEKIADKLDATHKMFDQKLMMTELKKSMDKLIGTARAIRNEQDDGFHKINKAIYDACIFWNEYFPFSIIDQLTAGWAAVQGEALDLLSRGGTADEMYNALLMYDQTIEDQFLGYNEKLAAVSTYMRGQPLIDRALKEIDRHMRIEKQRDLINKKFNLWYNEAGAASRNAGLVVQGIVSMTREMVFMVGKNVREPSEDLFGGAPFNTNNVHKITDWLKEWQAAAKDGYKLFQTAYKQFAQTTSDLWDSAAAQELKEAFNEDIHGFVEVANIMTTAVEDLKAVQTSVALRLKTWRDLLKTGVANHRLIAAYNDVERQKAFLVPYLKAAEIWTSDAVAAYLDAQTGAVEKKLAKEQKAAAAAAKGAAESGPDDGLNVRIVSNQLTLAESSRPTWRFAKVLEFVKLLAGQVPVVPDSIVDMSVVLVGHPEVRKEAAFAHLADGTAEKETAALRLMEGTALAQFEREQKSIPAATEFGIRDPDVGQNAEVEQKAKEEAEQDDNMRVARIGEAILLRIEALRDMLSDPQRFDEALLGIMTPYGAASVLTSWHVLQKSSRLYEKRSLAQMICAADLRIRTQFAKFCANQYNATDKRRPTRHAHGIDFANEINIEYDAVGKFLITQVRWNPAVRDADDCRASPWIICRATS